MNTAAFLEEGDPASDGRAFRRCLGEFATGVTVMTVQYEGQNVGMVVNSFAAVSLEPPLVLWSLRRESKSLPAFTQARHFAVNVLAQDQVDISQQFGRSSGDKFANVAWHAGRCNAPLLDGCVASFECSLETMHEGGDHLIVVGRVQRYARRGGAPLLFAQGRYGVVQEHPALAAAEGRAPATANPAMSEPETFMRLMFRAAHFISSRFDEQREAEGLSLAQARVLAWLYDRPATLETLTMTIYLGVRDTGDAVAELVQAGYIEQRIDGCIELTAQGRQRREGIGKRVVSFEDTLLEGLSAAKIAQVREVLLELTARAK